MLECSFTLKGISPLSFSRPIQSTKDTGESHDAFEERTWRERIHQDASGQCFIPPMALKNCLTDVAQFLGETVKGKGKATYTKHFKAGIMVTDPLPLLCGDKPIIAADVEGERLFVPSDGRRGGGSRVWKTFPFIPEWQASGTIILLDPLLIDAPAKIEEYLGHAGQFIGLLRFRPINNGYYGRYVVVVFKAGVQRKMA